jgi:predicted GNAT superfamily acetyltransferase
MSNAQPIIRTIVPSDFLKVLEINNSNVPALSELTLEKLHYLVEHSLHALVVEHHTLVGFCITFAPNAPYDSLNYLWFCERYAQFVYLDRIAFTSQSQGMGLGKLLYQHIEQLMRESRLEYPLCCEVNLEPPNPGSLRFHQSIGFIQKGLLFIQSEYQTLMLVKESSNDRRR